MTNPFVNLTPLSVLKKESKNQHEKQQQQQQQQHQSFDVSLVIKNVRLPMEFLRYFGSLIFFIGIFSTILSIAVFARKPLRSY